jgi:hypothetical protein
MTRVVPAPFLIKTSLHDGWVSDEALVKDIITRTKGLHAAWTIHAVRRVTQSDLEIGEYVVLLRAATGNSGALWYLNDQWLIVALADGGPEQFTQEPIAGVEYLCGPSYSTDCYE